MGKRILFYKYTLCTAVATAFLIVKETQNQNLYSIGWSIVCLIEFVLYFAYNKSLVAHLRKFVPLYLIIQQIALLSGSSANPLAIYHTYVPEHVLLIKFYGNSIGGKLCNIFLLVTILCKAFYTGAIYNLLIPNLGILLQILSEFFLLEGLLRIIEKCQERTALERTQFNGVLSLLDHSGIAISHE